MNPRAPRTRRAHARPRRGRALAAAFAAALALAGALAGSDPAAAGSIQGSPLALATVRLARPEAPAAADPARFTVEPGPLLAQRVITREWGPSDDSVYVEYSLPGYKSEGGAMLFSALVPGAGQLYVGEGSGWLFVAAEVAGWVSRWAFRERAKDFRDESLGYAGSPYDSTSNWSFLRYARATNGDTLELQRLYAGDRDAFFHLIGFDERFKHGWKSDAFVVRDAYQILEKKYQRHLKRARYATGAVILTHVAAALDALHAARKNNFPLQRNLRLRLEGSLGPDGEAVSFALERRF